MAELFIYSSEIGNYSIPADNAVLETLPLGNGVIPNVTSATVEKGENLSYELRFTFYGSYNDSVSKYIKVGAFVGAPVTVGDTQRKNRNYDFFKIYKIEQDIDGKRNVYAEHYSYALNNVFFKPMGNRSLRGIQDFVKYLNETSNFIYSYGINPGFVRCIGSCSENWAISTVQEETPVSVRNVINNLTKYDGSTLRGTIQMYPYRDVVYVKDPEVVDKIYYGSNLLTSTTTQDATETINAILPYWQDSSDSTVCVYGNVVSFDRKSQYLPYSQAKVMSFKDNYKTQPTQAQLEASAKTYLTNHQGELGNGGNILEKIEATYLPNTKIEIGDLIEVYTASSSYSTFKAVVTGYTYDCLNDRFTKVKLEGTTSIF